MKKKEDKSTLRRTGCQLITLLLDHINKVFFRSAKMLSNFISFSDTCLLIFVSFFTVLQSKLIHCNVFDRYTLNSDTVDDVLSILSMKIILFCEKKSIKCNIDLTESEFNRSWNVWVIKRRKYYECKHKIEGISS